MFQIQIDAKQIEQALPDYKYIKRLGSGTFAAVHLIQHRENQQQFALKKVYVYIFQVNCFGMGEYEKAGAANQVRILSSLVHKNLIKIYSCLFDNSQDTLYIFMEHASSGDLCSLIQQAKQKKKRVPESTIWKVINDVSDALKYLHQMQIIHRDLKPANVFRMGKNFKVGDMNVSKILKNGEAASTKTGSPFYTAPQVWDSENYNNKCDIWSLGVMIYEICSLQVPYEIESVFDISSRIKKQKQKNLPTIYSTSLNQLVKKMLQFDPANRLSAEQIYKISKQKLNIQTQGAEQKVVDSLMNTIVFPETNQRWVNLVALPPKTTRREISSSQIQERQKSLSKQKSKKKNENSLLSENQSGIFKTNERKPILLPRNKSKSRLEKSSQKSQLPPISKAQSKQKKIQKRNGSSQSRTRRKSISQTVSQVKSIINSQQSQIKKQ